MVFIVLNGHCLYQTGVGGQTVEHTQMLDCHPEGSGQPGKRAQQEPQETPGEQMPSFTPGKEKKTLQQYNPRTEQLCRKRPGETAS